MARLDRDIDNFFNLPEVKRLISIARSDNSLIALDVQRREVSWTKFMAWLLNPVRHDLEVVAERLQPLLDLTLQRSPTGAPIPTGQPIQTVITVAAEHDAGEAGRLDLFIRCRVGGKAVRLLIENKIDALEHHEQLAGYVQHHGVKCGDDTLLPILIELGDAPVSIVVFTS